MKITQKDPVQFISKKDRQDQARKHQIIFPRTMESDAKLLAAIEIHLLEGLEARGQQKLHGVIDHLRNLRDGMPTPKHSPKVILPGNK